MEKLLIALLLGTGTKPSNVHAWTFDKDGHWVQNPLCAAADDVNAAECVAVLIKWHRYITTGGCITHALGMPWPCLELVRVRTCAAAKQHFRLHGVVLLHTYILPCTCRITLKLLLKLAGT